MSFNITTPFTISLAGQTFSIPSLKINPGELAIFHGRSNASISILLRLFAGAMPNEIDIPPAEGKIRSTRQKLSLEKYSINLSDKNIYSDSDIYQKIGFVSSNPDLNILGRTIREDYISASLAIGATSEIPILSVGLRQFGLSEKLEYETKFLSGGEKLRLNWATALIGKREMLVADFTTLTLDEDFREFMIKTINHFILSGGIALVSGISKDDFEKFTSTKIFFECQVSDSVLLSLKEEGELKNLHSIEEERKILKKLLEKRNDNGELILESKGLRYFNVSQPVSISIKAGEILILKGKNGLGKTTFGKILTKRISSKKVVGSLKLKEDVIPAMATQFPEEMILGLEFENELPDQNLRDLCGLPKTLNSHNPCGFSYGAQKLICVANALRLSKKLAILDEPTSGMDYQQKLRLISLLNQFPNLSIIIITHDPALDNIGTICELNEPQP